MANPTTNYGFVLPTNTDLVTDLPADFEIALQGVDTRMKALNPETTTGDIAYRSATANTNTRLALGTAGQVLTVNSGATAPEWAIAPGASAGLTRLTTLNPSAVSEIIADSVFSATYDNYLIVGYLNLTGNASLTMQLRSGGSNLTTNTYVTSQFGVTTNYTEWYLSDNIATDKNFMFNVTLTRPFLATVKQGVLQTARQTAASYQSGIYEPTATSRDGFRLFCSAGTFTGQVVVYGLAE